MADANFFICFTPFLKLSRAGILMTYTTNKSRSPFCGDQRLYRLEQDMISSGSNKKTGDKFCGFWPFVLLPVAVSNRFLPKEVFKSLSID